MKKMSVMMMVLAGALLLASCASSKVVAKEQPADILKVNNCTTVAYKLPVAVDSGAVVKVTITGTNTGDTGFRSWLIDDSQTTNSNQFTASTFTSFKDLGGTMVKGKFSFTYELTASASATNLFLKAPSWNAKINGVEIDSITVTINGVTTQLSPSSGETA